MDADDYSNDSFADNESSFAGEKRFKKANFSNLTPQQQQSKDSRLAECLNYLHRLLFCSFFSFEKINHNMSKVISHSLHFVLFVNIV